MGEVDRIEKSVDYFVTKGLSLFYNFITINNLLIKCVSMFTYILKKGGGFVDFSPKKSIWRVTYKTHKR